MTSFGFPNKFNKDSSLISEFLVKSVYKLKNWIDTDKLDWSTLSLNPNAIYLLDQIKAK